MAEDFYSNFVTNRKRKKRRTICIFSIFNCLQIRSEIRFLWRPTHFQKGQKTQKHRLQLKFATDFSQISYRVASLCGTQMVIFSKPPNNILPPFWFLLQPYLVAIVPSLPYELAVIRRLTGNWHNQKPEIPSLRLHLQGIWTVGSDSTIIVRN